MSMIIQFPKKSLNIDKYWELEFELAKIADYFKLTREQLVESAHLLPEYIYHRVQDVIDEQSFILGI